MLREKATCLPQLTTENLPQKLALDHPRTTRHLDDHTSETNNTNKKQYKKAAKTVLEKLKQM